MSQILCIDGSVLEGGGQILRMSVSLSAILRIPIRVTNIRANRSKPDMCKAKVKGDFIGSKEIELIPGAITGGLYEVDIGTAGSISLLLQVALPCALFADSPVTLVLRGGTNVQMAPQIDYMEHVFRKLLNHFGADFNLQIIRRGYKSGELDAQRGDDNQGGSTGHTWLGFRIGKVNLRANTVA
ncbi:unnamed protein product [Leptidea sinapis]|uniref:RNA 3'-terminal phosphate cyclase n=1 Tax=Leptidea sinapis TaxID=189913 RepID=A0A5E4QMD6_9NEOP|nr:unnamed protein product [Leptidea sinapis]